VAQVFKGSLKDRTDPRKRTPVAVKLIHPHVQQVGNSIVLWLDPVGEVGPVVSPRNPRSHTRCAPPCGGS
jgi:hypothetical protein